VLSTSLLVFAVISMIIMCVEKANGGTFPTKCVTKDLLPPVCTGATAGNWDPAGIIPVFVFSGIPFGAIEIVRRIIPQQIVGGNEMKLKKLDSLVHIYYEVAGTTGAFFAAYTSLILGKAYAPVITPILYVFAAALFYFIIPPKSKEDISLATGTTAELTTMFLKSLWYSFYGFGESVYQGALIIFAESKYHWLVWGYTIPLGTSALVAIPGPVFPSVLTALPFSPFRRHTLPDTSSDAPLHRKRHCLRLRQVRSQGVGVCLLHQCRIQPGRAHRRRIRLLQSQNPGHPPADREMGRPRPQL
jgi:hypothetical protein